MRNMAGVVSRDGSRGCLRCVAIDAAELTLTPARGVMVISPDNQNGPAEAQLIKLPAP